MRAAHVYQTLLKILFAAAVVGPSAHASLCLFAPRHDADAMPPILAVMPGVDHVDAPCVLLSLGGMSGAGAQCLSPKPP